MNKKLLATVLASTMVLGSMSAYAVPVTAPPDLDLSNDYTEINDAAAVASGIKIDGSTEIEPVTIKVTLPTKLPMLLNPYKIDLDDQVVAPVATITNGGNTALKATVVEWAIEGISTDAGKDGKPTMATATVTDKSIKKEAFIYLQSAIDADPATEYDAKADKVKVVPAKAGKVTSVFGVIPKASGTMKLQWQGSLSTNVAWGSDDKIVISPTFKFEPTMPAA